ncbi:MAG: hypothetical protein ABIP01_05060 [Candidatus Limnocylindria bacterium]
MDRRSVRIDQAVELLSLPGEVGIQTRAERIGDTVQRTEGHAFPMAVLDQANDTPRHPGNGREIRLGQPQSVPQDSETIAEATPHAPMMTNGRLPHDHPPLTAIRRLNAFGGARLPHNVLSRTHVANEAANWSLW